MVVQMCYVGPREKGQEYLAAISSWDGEKCLLNEVNEKSFFHQQDSVAQVLRGKGRLYYPFMTREFCSCFSIQLADNGSFDLLSFPPSQMTLSTTL